MERRKVTSALLFTAWITFMALAGFFIPSFLSDLPFLRIKEIRVEGNTTLDLNTVKSAIYSFDGILRLEEEKILSVLNERTGGRVKRVFVSREFTPKGISVRIRIEERKPVAKVRLGKYFSFIDEEGVTFPAYEKKDLPEIVAYDLEILRRNFPKLYRAIRSSGLEVDLIRVLRDRTEILSGKRVLILPPLDLMPDNVAERLRIVYNFREGKIDLRFDRFILVRN